MIHSVTLPASSRPRRGGFTLIELLTVIAIIGILAAIIIPVVGKVRTTAKRSQGLSNLRQIALAGLSFTQDNRGRWFKADRENGVFYAEVLSDYIAKTGTTRRNEMFYDPLLPKPEGNQQPLHFAVIGIYFSDNMWEASMKAANDISKMKAPAKTIFFADNWSDRSGTSWEMPYISDTGSYNIWGFGSDGEKFPPPEYGVTQGHVDLQRDPGQAKVAFFDAHVAVLKREELKQRLFDPRIN